MAKLDRWRQMGPDEARVVRDMTLRNELSGGTRTVRSFEAAWRRMTGLKYSLTTVNGTTSLYSAMFGLGVGPGDEVIAPAYNWICSIAPAPFLGGRPVFCDTAPGSVVASPEDVARRITKRTRAIIAVHLWGWVCDMDAIMKVSRRTGVPVIEDCSHAHGATYRGRPVGSIGAVACWSLQGSKAVSAGEAGVLATNDREIFERACLVGQVNRIAGMDLVARKYRRYQPLGTGMKFRSHPLAIGIASVQLRRLPRLNAGRARWVAAIERGIGDIPFLSPVPVVAGGRRGGYYGFPVLFRPEAAGGMTMKDFVGKLRAAGLEAGTNQYPLLHLLPYFAEGFDLFTRRRGPLGRGWHGYRKGDLPESERLVENLVFLPVLTEPVRDAVRRVLDVIHRAAR